MRLIDADALLMNMNLAIAILEGTMKNLGLQDDAECQMELKAYRDIRDVIKDEPTAEPPAQPEQRTCVNCGRTVNNGGWYADGGTRCPIEEHYALPKDGYCHLWEKRNVTDDDYPERREE